MKTYFHLLVAAFSSDWTDTRRGYDCNDVRDIQLTLFIFDVIDRDPCTNEVTEVEFRDSCFAIQTVFDCNKNCP